VFEVVMESEVHWNFLLTNTGMKYSPTYLHAVVELIALMVSIVVRTVSAN
jgi:hypothetical protein